MINNNQTNLVCNYFLYLTKNAYNCWIGMRKRLLSMCVHKKYIIFVHFPIILLRNSFLDLFNLAKNLVGRRRIMNKRRLSIMNTFPLCYGVMILWFNYTPQFFFFIRKWLATLTSILSSIPFFFLHPYANHFIIKTITLKSQQCYFKRTVSITDKITYPIHKLTISYFNRNY